MGLTFHRTTRGPGTGGLPDQGGRRMILLRREMGDALRECRVGQGRTLRDISSAASVSLGYLSEIERGEKEASSELLAAVCGALELPLSVLLGRVAQRAAVAEGAGTLGEGACPPVALPVPHELPVQASAA